MDARLRERRGVLRVSASQHIDCNVRRRSHRADAFFHAPGVNLFSGFVPHVDTALIGRSISCVSCGRSGLRLLRPALPCPTFALRPALPAAAFARRAPHPPQPSTSGGKSLILKRVADNRAPYSRFRSRSVSKTATRSEMFEKPPLIRSQPALERWLLTQSSSHPSRNVSKTATHQQISAKQRGLSSGVHVFKATLTFIFLKLIEIGTLNLKSSSSQIINPL